MMQKGISGSLKAVRQAGAEHVLALLRDELDVALALCGCTRLAELERDLLATRV